MPQPSVDQPVVIVVRKQYEEANLVSARYRKGDILFATDNFVHVSASEPDREKFTPMFTLGQTVSYGQNRIPRYWNYAGMLVDTTNDGSATEQWIAAYEQYLRGTRCAAIGAEVELRFRDQVRYGALMQTTMSRSSNDRSAVAFAFTMFVTAVADRPASAEPVNG
jgi:hypothetical protein